MRNLNQFIGEFREGFQTQNRFRACVFAPTEMLMSMIPKLANPFKGATGLGSVLETAGELSDLHIALPATAQWLARGVLINATRLPSRAFETVDQRMYGVTEKMPYNSEYTSIATTMLIPLVMKDAVVPRFFNFWQNMIQNQFHGPEDGADMGFPDDYYGSMIIGMFDKQNFPTLIYKFERIYPATVDSTELNWATQNEHLPYHVTFNYSYHKILHRSSPEALAFIAAAAIGQ